MPLQDSRQAALCHHFKHRTCRAAQLSQLPAKLNAVVQPLVGALRREPEPALRAVAADALAELVALCVTRQPSPNDRCGSVLRQCSAGDDCCFGLAEHGAAAKRCVTRTLARNVQACSELCWLNAREQLLERGLCDLKLMGTGVQ